MADATTTMPADPRTLNCPSWCQTDHAQEWAGAVDLDAEAARLLAEYPEHYSKVLGTRGDQGRPVPPFWCPPIHRRALGTVTVRVGDGTQADQLEVERERFDADDRAPVEVVRVDQPTGWTEDYTAAEARGLAALLQAGAGAIEGSSTTGVPLNLGQVLEMLDGGAEQDAPDSQRGYRVTALLWSLLTQQVLPAQVWPLLRDGDVPTLDGLIFVDEPIEGSSDTAADRRSRG